ncbi:D-amino-acid transaminase [Alkalihalobacillus oceani]|uniref:D-amino-acid transaminase n=1 Tax=Halalkalibacter oceani TaxID=1653776 RepID=UPI002041E97A|nr:D-amino-acid transaminase [Halalkalibacter oceani]MCM3762731.1 D-amino-acid transaminase [Halalkalibacter oceani]
MTYILQNADLVQKETAHLHIDDRGYYFGDGIYEVVRVYDGVPFAKEAHLTRLEESSAKIDMTLPYSGEDLIDLLDKLLEANELVNGLVYLQVTRGVEPRNHLYTKNCKPVLTAFTQPLPKKTAPQTAAVSVWLTDDIRWLRCDIKTINLLGNIIAKKEAADQQCQEAIMQRDGLITEGSSSNLFLVKDQVLYTHPATNLILNGITRQVVIDLAKQSGYEVVEEPFPVDVLEHADEAFLTSTTMEIAAIRQIKGQMDTSYEPGPVTKDLQEKFQQLLAQK